MSFLSSSFGSYVHSRIACVVTVCFLLPASGSVHAQSAVENPERDHPHSRNVEIASVVMPEAFGSVFAASDNYPEVRLDQDPGRPFAYVSSGEGFWVVDVSNEARPEVVRSVVVPAAEGASSNVSDVQLAAIDGRHVIIAAVAHTAQGDADALAIYDVTSPRGDMPYVAGYRSPDSKGFTNIFAYAHSSRVPVLFATGGEDILALDLRALVGGQEPLIARYPTPALVDERDKGFDDVYASFEPVTQQDRVYGAGAGGYYVYDVTDMESPSIVARVSAAAVQRGTRIAASPDGRYLVTAAGYRTTPVYIFDIAPALDGRQPSVRTAVGAWTANWRNKPRMFEVRWPYIFVAALHDGFHVVNMRDAEQPYTVGFVRTWTGTLPRIAQREKDNEGAWGIDVRSVDGLVAVTDRQSGLWLLRVEGFGGWDGNGWGMPDASSVQDWVDGPDGAATE